MPFNKQGGGRAWPGEELARALLPLAGKIKLRYWLESVRLVLTWGLAGAACMHALLRLYPFASSSAAAYTGLGLGLTVVITRIVNRPGALEVVRMADALGLAGDAITAYRLLQGEVREPWARAAVQESLRACSSQCAKITAGYPLLTGKRPWLNVLLLSAVLGVSHLVPGSLAPYWEEKGAEREALEMASRRAREAVERVQKLNEDEDLLPAEVRKGLAELPAQVKRSGSLQEAADRLEKARWQLEEARAALDPAPIQDLQRLQEAWQGMEGKQWQELRAALESQDASQIQASVQKLLNAREGEESRQQTAAGLFQGAGAVKDQSLRSALQEAAAAVMDAGDEKNGQQQEQRLAGAAGALGRELAGAVNAASAAGTLGQSSGLLGELAAALGSASSPAGAVTAMAGSGPGATGSPAGEQEAGAGAGGTGRGNSSTSSSGENGGGGSGSGNSGSNSASGTGAGGPGSGGPGAGKTGSSSELVFTPFLPDGAGENLQVPGEVHQGEEGTQVAMPNSPTTLGAVRPLREVYGQYLAEAHETLSRDPLPRDMEQLVWQYFNSLQGGSEDKE